jgi:arylsulfatase
MSARPDRGRRGLAVVLGVGLVVPACRRDPFRLPERIRVEELVADLSGTFTPAAVAEQSPADPVHAGGIQPGVAIEIDGGDRAALIAPPPSRMRFQVHVPPDARLRFGVGMQSPGRRDRGAAGVRFTVEIDGRAAYSRSVNPAATRRDRRWFDVDVPVGDAERTVEVVLRTERVGRGDHLAGAPGWSHVRIVRDTWRDRQPVRVDRPSVLVVLVDTLRADAVGRSTPTLDRLAATGTRFEQMEAQASWTMPAVATLMTGLHPRSHGVVGTAADPAAVPTTSDPAFVSDALVTLPKLAQQAGITTIGISSNPLISRATNFASGFETFVEAGWERTRRNWPRGTTVTDPFLAWLRRNGGTRFFAYLHYMEPHDPYTPSPADRPRPPPGAPAAIAIGDVAPIAKRMNQGAGGAVPPDQVAYLRRLYDLEVRDWDAELGRVLAGLDASGVRGSTIVVVVADHGEEFEEHGRLKHGIHLYEELLHVPLVIAGPGIPVGRVPETVQGIDVMPTLAALLGIDPPPGLPGQPLFGPREERPVFAETREGIMPDGRRADLVSVRSGGWKLIQAPALGVSELYDLSTDPGEHANRLDGAPQAAELASLLDGWRRTVPPPPPAGGHDPRLHEKLRALGYVD